MIKNKKDKNFKNFKVSLSLGDELEAGDYYLAVSDKVKDNKGIKLKNNTVVKIEVQS